MNLSSVNILSQIPSSAIWHSLKIITVCFYQIQNQTNNRFKTLNSKAIGRLLAAGGVYNGNIEGFRDTAENCGDAIKGYDQILNEKTAGIAIATASILLTKRSNVDTYTEINSYLGKLRGQQKLLDGIDIIEIIYIKRPSKDLANLRKEFNKTVRKIFLSNLQKPPKHLKDSTPKTF